MSSTPTLGQVLKEALRETLERVHTALPGRIVSYDATTQTAEVQLMVKNPEGVSYAPLPSVPIAFQRAGDAFLSMPLAAGHFVLCLFCEASIGQWRATGAESNPGDVRRHQLGAPIAIPCAYPVGQALDDAHAGNVVVGFDGGVQVHVTPEQVSLGSEAPDSGVALGDLVDARLQAVDNFFRVTLAGNPSATPLTPAALAALWTGLFPLPPVTVESDVVFSD